MHRLFSWGSLVLVLIALRYLGRDESVMNGV